MFSRELKAHFTQSTTTEYIRYVCRQHLSYLLINQQYLAASLKRKDTITLKHELQRTRALQSNYHFLINLLIRRNCDA
jgi:hypothetical protein